MTEATTTTSTGKRNNNGNTALPGAKETGKQRLNDLFENNQLSNAFRFKKSPTFIHGKLRNYQIDALNWLISLHENQVGGILADEMGLGKTLQSISMLGYLKFFKKINGPFLVIGPKSVISTWMDEFKTFCPSIRVIQLTDDKTIQNDRRIQWDACVTTFDTMFNKNTFFQHYQWHYVVVDEAHWLTNETTKFGEFIRKLRSKNRLLLTCTPLQNNLRELWAHLNYHRAAVFSRPCFLRRMKADVETTLLPKIEYKLFVGLTKLQRDTYLKAANSKSKIHTTVLEDLRKIASHPYLIHGVEPKPYKTYAEHLVNNSGKMMLLDKLLTKLKSRGSRVLLFSQFVDMLDIIQDYLNCRNYKFRRLDATTSFLQRANVTDNFMAENSEVFIFIILTQAGALGINLQGADTVIIFDPDLNPQIDLQAIDRAHRIGQQKQVYVFRLVTENTVDEFIVQSAKKKLLSNDMMIQQGRTFENSKIDDNVKRSIIHFGMDSLLALGETVITGVNLDKVIAHSIIKTQEATEKFNESEMRNMALEKPSFTPVNNSENSSNDSIRGIQQSNQSLSLPESCTETLQKDNEIQLRNISSMKLSSTSVDHSQIHGKDNNRVLQQSNQNETLLPNKNTNLKTTFLMPSIHSVNHSQKPSKYRIRVIQQCNQNQASLPNSKPEDGTKKLQICNENEISEMAFKKQSITSINHNSGNDSIRVIQQSNQSQPFPETLQKGDEIQPRNIESVKLSPTSVDHSQIRGNDNIRVIQQSNQNQTLLPNKDTNSKLIPSITSINHSQTPGNNSVRVIQQCNQSQTSLPKSKPEDSIKKLQICNENQITEMAFKKQSITTPINHNSGNDRIRVIQLSKLLPPNSKPEDGIEKLQKCNENQLRNIALVKPSIAAVNHSQIHSNDNFGVVHESNQNQTLLPNKENHSKPASEKSSMIPVNHSQTPGNDCIGVIQQSNQNFQPNQENDLKPEVHIIHLHVYQFYPTELIVQCDGFRSLNLSTNTKAKVALLAQGFDKWSLIDYKIFCEAVQKFGRFDLASVAEMIPSKTMEEVAKYHEVFFRRGPLESGEIRNIVKNIALEEMKNRNRVDALRWKMLHFGTSEFEATLNAQRQHSKFTRDHDRYLICAASRYGVIFDVCDRVIADIRFHSDFGLFLTFRFGTFTNSEIKERLNILISSIQKEYVEKKRLTIDEDTKENLKKQKLN